MIDKVLICSFEATLIEFKYKITFAVYWHWRQYSCYNLNLTDSNYIVETRCKEMSILDDISYLLEWLPVVYGEDEQHGVRVPETDLDR